MNTIQDEKIMKKSKEIHFDYYVKKLKLFTINFYKPLEILFRKIIFSL